jgi:hypothetical protein
MSVTIITPIGGIDAANSNDTLLVVYDDGSYNEYKLDLSPIEDIDLSQYDPDELKAAGVLDPMEALQREVAALKVAVRNFEESTKLLEERLALEHKLNKILQSEVSNLMSETVTTTKPKDDKSAEKLFRPLDHPFKCQCVQCQL